jgi:ribosome-associated toxin RatA of RatAB toxin-antitoxin module
MKRKLLPTVACVAFLASSTAPMLTASASEDPERYSVLTPRSEIKAGAARAQVHAPLEVVRKAVTNFDSYGEYIRRFEKAKVVGRHGEATDIYLQVPIMKGTAKVWAVMRFEPKPCAADEVVVVGRMLKGNVKRLDAQWRLSKIDDANTKLDLQLLIIPDFIVPIPSSLVTSEASSAAQKAVRGLRTASEQQAR